MTETLTALASTSWFRSAAGRRYGIEIGVIVVAKLIALIVLYAAFVASQPRADASADALRAHLLDTAPPDGTTHDRR